MKASPAPVVSTTGPALKAGTSVDPVLVWRSAPASPSVISAAPTPFARKHVARLSRVVDAGHRNAGQQRRLALVRRDVVAERVDRIVDGLGGRRIEDGDDAGRLGDLQAAPRRGDRLLELGDEDGGRRGSRRRPRRRRPALIVPAAPGTTMMALSPVWSLTIDEGGAGRLVGRLDDPRP